MKSTQPARPGGVSRKVRRCLYRLPFLWASCCIGQASAADSNDTIFSSGNESWTAVCSTRIPILKFFYNVSPEPFFNRQWQQSNYGDACGESAEMLGFKDAECNEYEHHPGRHECRADLCCGTPPPVPTCDQPGSSGPPPEAIDVEPAEDVDETRGTLSELYPGVNTSTDAFHEQLGCDDSIGDEELPPEVDEPPEAEDLMAEQAVTDYENGRGAALAIGQDTTLPLDVVIPDAPPIGGWCRKREPDGNLHEVSCLRQLDPSQPFDGRDVIYVRGFGLGQIQDALSGSSGALQRWPRDADAFLAPDGYFRREATEYWRDHIAEHLWSGDPSAWGLSGWQWWAGDPEPTYAHKKNRYLIVAWSTNQRLAYAQNAFLAQVSAAIRHGTNVSTPPDFPADQERTFCANGCVVISHSTGGLLVSSTFGAVQRGDYGPEWRNALENNFRVHVAFNGAMSGSRLASAALSVSNMVTGTQGNPRLCDLITELAGAELCRVTAKDFLEQTVLVDLMPKVAQQVWGPVLSQSPVRTLTVAGGHPRGNYLLGLTKLLLPGIDDGVVTANSACGNPAFVAPDGAVSASGIIGGNPLKVYDLGDAHGGQRARAIRTGIEQKLVLNGTHPGGPLYIAGMCTPYLAPNGMRLPVLDSLSGTAWDTRKRWPNHYSMIQSVADHSYDGGGDGYDRNPWPSAEYQPASAPRHYLNTVNFSDNTEESSAVTDAGIYQQDWDGTYLVKPEFGESVEVVKGKRIKFRLFRKTRYIWLWKRSYERLKGWETKQDSHYVYEFVARH